MVFKNSKKAVLLSFFFISLFSLSVLVPEITEARELSFEKASGSMNGGKALGNVTNVLLDLFDSGAVITIVLMVLLVAFMIFTGKASVLQSLGLAVAVALVLTYGFSAIQFLSAGSGAFVG